MSEEGRVVDMKKYAQSIPRFVQVIANGVDYSDFKEKIKDWTLEKLIHEFGARKEDSSIPRYLIRCEIERRVIEGKPVDVSYFVINHDKIPEYLIPVFWELACQFEDKKLTTTSDVE